MRCIVLLAMLGSLPVLDVEAANVDVNCNKGQTIGAALAQLNPHGPNTVNVRGTCAEVVDIGHFERLTLRGKGAAVIAAPLDVSKWSLVIHNSREILVRALTVGSVGGISADLSDCLDCQIHDSTMEGHTSVDASRVLFMRDTFRANGGFAAVAIYDSSLANIVNCSVEPGSEPTAGGVLAATGSSVQVGGTDIRGFPVGIMVDRAYLTLANLSAPFYNYAGDPVGDPDQTVVIESSAPGGWSIQGNRASVIGVGPVARLGGDGSAGGGILVNANSTVTVGAGAEVTHSNGVGVMAMNGSHVELMGGARIVETSGNGLVVVNNSTATGGGSGTVEISGSSAQDVFCDATSLLSKVNQIVATKVTCPNQNNGLTAPLPTP